MNKRPLVEGLFTANRIRRYDFKLIVSGKELAWKKSNLRAFVIQFSVFTFTNTNTLICR